MHLKQRLERRAAQGNVRQLRLMPDLIDFASNDTLGLARCPALACDVAEEWKKKQTTLNGLGSTGSRLLTGNTAYAQELEAGVAAFHGYPAALLFNCGYMANVGLLSTLSSPHSVILFDAGVHASVRDGIRLGRAAAFPFRHNDLEHLENRLKQCTKECFICVESLYSTDGSMAPLAELCALARNYGAHLIVDEAHAVGVFGPQGRGLAHALTPHVFAQVVTFGKALGTQGAIVLGSALLIQALINFAHSAIYTTALPLHMLAAIHCSYLYFPQMDAQRKKLQQLITLWQTARSHSSLSHIQSIPLPGNAPVRQEAERLTRLGFDVRALLSPTVQRGHETLRICLHAFNTEAEVRGLLDALH